MQDNTPVNSPLDHAIQVQVDKSGEQSFSMAKTQSTHSKVHTHHWIARVGCSASFSYTLVWFVFKNCLRGKLVIKTGWVLFAAKWTWHGAQAALLLLMSACRHLLVFALHCHSHSFSLIMHLLVTACSLVNGAGCRCW